METIHIISHTHWDREWYKTFQQFRLRLVHMLDNVLALLREDPDFKHFMLDGQSIVLEDYLEMRPERETEIRDLVQSGRLIIGPWYILPDEFLVSPESVVRNLLEGQRVCDRFGPKMNIGYIPDPFGHIGQMPQILNGFDIHSACLWRGLADEPIEFWWQSPDGTAVLMIYLRESYGNAASLLANDPARFGMEALHLATSLASHSACSQRLLMFGTDHSEPPKETSSAIAFTNDNFNTSCVIHSTLPAYFDATIQELASTGVYIPTVQGELRSSKRSSLLPGVLSTRIWIKQRNHTCETMLERWAEPFCAWASLVSNDPATPSYNLTSTLQNPSGMLRQAWRILLTCQPHDSICGCSIDQVHEEMKPRFDQVEQVATELTLQSLGTLARNVDTRMPEDCFAAVTVFNPLPGKRSEPVELELNLPVGVDAFEVLEIHGVGTASVSLPFDSLGLGGGELIHMIMSPEDFQQAAGKVQGGRVTGMAIQGIDYQRKDDTILVNIVLSERGEPDLEAIAIRMGQLDSLYKDDSIHHFEVVARSEDAAKLLFLPHEVNGPGLCTFWLRKTTPINTRKIELNLLSRLALPLARQLINLPVVKRWLNPAKSARPPYRIENEVYRIEANRTDGSLELIDKRTGVHFVGLNQFVDGGDCGDTYNYCPPMMDRFFMDSKVQRVEISAGRIIQQMDIFSRLGVPDGLDSDRKVRTKKIVDFQIHTTIKLWSGGERVDIQTKITNPAKDHRVRVHFPMPFSTSYAAYDSHFDIVERPIGLPEWDQTWAEQPRPEQPQRMFTELHDGNTGFILAVRGLPEVEVLENAQGMSEIALTLMRCVGWLSRDDLVTRPGHAGPFLATPGAQMPGEYVFDYSLICYSRDTDLRAHTAAIQQARYFNAPMRTELTGIHPGVLSSECQMIQVKPAEFEISSIKQAEDASSWIVRGYNRLSEPIEVTVQPWRKFSTVELVRIDESRLGQIESDSEGKAKLVVNPHSIVTIRFSD